LILLFLESWSQIKQRPPVGNPTQAGVQVIQTVVPGQAAVPKPTVPIYPIKRFVRSQESGRGGVEDELDDNPICQRVFDVAVCNKVLKKWNLSGI